MIELLYTILWDRDVACLQDTVWLSGGGSRMVGAPGASLESTVKNYKVWAQFSELWNNKDELMLCKLKYLHRDSEICQHLCQTVVIFRERNWVFPWRYNYSFLNHLSKLHCLFPFPHNCPFQLMGLEGSEYIRWG